MTKNPECCLVTDSVVTVAQKMRSEDVGSVPIIEESTTKRLVGIVTDRDLVLKVIAAGRDGESVTASEVMNTGLVTCRMDDDVKTAVRKMATYQVRRIPVVDNEGSIRGIVAQADVATKVDEAEVTGEMVEEISR
jgi:CBS domain-containing protein